LQTAAISSVARCTRARNVGVAGGVFWIEKEIRRSFLQTWKNIEAFANRSQVSISEGATEGAQEGGGVKARSPTENEREKRCR